MSKVYTFEVTPYHPTRKVYDSVIYPNGPVLDKDDFWCYEKEMTVQQAIAAMNTCAYVKIKYNDKWYFVTKENIDDITAVIDAGDTLTEDETNIGIRTIQSYIVPIESDVDAYGKPAGTIADMKIEDGYLYGTVYPVTGYTGFSSDEVYQSGYYLPFAWTTNTNYTEPKMRVINGTDPTKEIALDPINVVYLGADVVAGGHKIIEITATDVDGNTASVTLVSSKLKFDANPSPYIAPTTSDVPDQANADEPEAVVG